MYIAFYRAFIVALPINSTAGIKEFKNCAGTIRYSQPGIFNQATMEFGARYCVPQNPDCPNCIFNDRCVAFKNNKVAELPVKLKKLKVKKRYFNYLVIVSEDHKTLLEQRKGKGIWQHLYQFPLIESSAEISEEKLFDMKDFKNIAENIELKSTSRYNDNPVIHKLTHQNLFTTFWIVETGKLKDKGVAISEIEKYPVPVLVSNFLNTFSFINID